MSKLLAVMFGWFLVMWIYPVIINPDYVMTLNYASAWIVSAVMAALVSIYNLAKNRSKWLSIAALVITSAYLGIIVMGVV